MLISQQCDFEITYNSFITLIFLINDHICNDSNKTKISHIQIDIIIHYS